MVKTALRALARRWQALQAEIDDLDTQLAPLVTAAAPELLSLPGVGVETAGQLLVTAGITAAGSSRKPRSPGCAALPRSRCSPAALTGTAYIAAGTGRQQRPVAHRPGPDGLPPAHQGLRDPPHRRGQD